MQSIQTMGDGVRTRPGAIVSPTDDIIIRDEIGFHTHGTRARMRNCAPRTRARSYYVLEREKSIIFYGRRPANVVPIFICTHTEARNRAASEQIHGMESSFKW